MHIYIYILYIYVHIYMCPCGTTIESRTHIVGECEIYEEERDALEETRKLE